VCRVLGRSAVRAYELVGDGQWWTQVLAGMSCKELINNFKFLIKKINSFQNIILNLIKFTANIF